MGSAGLLMFSEPVPNAGVRGIPDKAVGGGIEPNRKESKGEEIHLAT